EKSPEELSNLGKIIIASLKAMMAAGLGDEVEGDYRDVILRKPTNSPTPYVCIMDEYGYYAVPGFAVVPAQARSLGFSA
ncbi:MAG TPA: phosphoesterase, partial [Candidatus Berkiella sp.]|nr:phosphoesterase [Candidatus Berkiella sp.]